jgi:hypothetical protein
MLGMICQEKIYTHNSIVHFSRKKYINYEKTELYHCMSTDN